MLLTQVSSLLGYDAVPMGECFPTLWTVILPSFWLSGNWMRMLGLLDPEDDDSHIRNYLPIAQNHVPQEQIFHDTAVRTSNPTCYLFQFCVLHVHI